MVTVLMLHMPANTICGGATDANHRNTFILVARSLPCPHWKGETNDPGVSNTYGGYSLSSLHVHYSAHATNK